MKKFLLLFIISVSFYTLSIAQEHFITYNNDTEKSLITAAAKPDDFIKLALAADLKPGEADNTFNKLVNDITLLNSGAGSDEKPERRLKRIFQMTHAAFLKEYVENAHFSEIFTNGNYQCVGASILYAYILETLNIPYQIKELPTHVYVVAYPETYNILIETTDPAKGYYVPDDKTKANYVSAIVKEKYIDQAYVDKVGINQAFNEFFYSKTNISLKEAVGILYFNKAVEKSEDGKINEAYSDIAKADILYPDKKNEFLKTDLMASMITNFKYNELKDWEALTYLTNGKSATEETRKYLQFQFDDLLNNKLLKAGKKQEVDSVYNYLFANVADSAVRMDIQQNYLYENAHYAYMINDNPTALYYMEKDYNINPENPMVESAFVDQLTIKLSSQNGSVQNLSILNTYMTKYPRLAKNQRIRSIYVYNIAYLGFFAYNTEDGVKGEKYMKMLTAELDTYPNHDDKYDMLIASVFAKASEYYYRKQGRQKCIAVLNSGLKYEPQSEVLLRKLKVNTQGF